MKYEANVYQMIVESHIFWVAESKALKGCTGQGETSEEAIKELEQNEDIWLETAAEVGIPIPDRTAKNDSAPSGKFALRLSPLTYSDAIEVSGELGLSLNQFFSNAITEYIARSKEFLRRPITSSTSNVISFPASTQRKRLSNIFELEELEEM